MITQRLANALENQSISLDKFAREVYMVISNSLIEIDSSLLRNLEEANKEVYDAIKNEPIERL